MKFSEARAREVYARNSAGERISRKFWFTRLIAVCLALAECGSPAQVTSPAKDLDQAVQEQIQRLRDKDPKVRINALAELYLMGPALREAVPDLIIVLTKDPSDMARNYAAMVLGQVGPEAEEAVPALVTTFNNDSSGHARKHALQALGKIGPGAQKAVPALTTVLTRHTPEDLVGYASEALGKIGPGAKEAVHALITILTSDGHPGLRDTAAIALGGIGPGAKEAVPALIAALNCPNSEKSEPYNVFHYYNRTPEGVPEEMCPDVAEALGKIGPGAKLAIPALTTLLTKNTDANLRKTAAEALGMIGSGVEETAPALTIAISKDVNDDVRKSAAVALTRLADAMRDSKRTTMIAEMNSWSQSLKANSFPAEAADVRTAIDVLQAIRPAWYEVLYRTMVKHPYVAYSGRLILFSAYSGLLFFFGRH